MILILIAAAIFPSIPLKPQQEVADQLALMQKQVNKEWLRPLPASRRPRFRDMNVLPSFKPHSAWTAVRWGMGRG